MIRTPVISGRVKVLSERVGFAQARVNSKLSALEPSKTKLPVAPINNSPLIVDPALDTFSSSSSWIPA